MTDEAKHRPLESRNKEFMRNPKSGVLFKPRTNQLVLSACLLTALGFLMACAGSKAVSPTASTDSEMRRYSLKGKVIAANVKHHKVVIAHEDIPNYMEAMTMPFTLLDEAMLRELKQGDSVKATLVFDEQTNRSWLEDFVVTEKNAAGHLAARQ